MSDAVTLLTQVLRASIADEQWQWLDSQRHALPADSSNKTLHITLGLIPRKLGRADLNVNPQQCREAREYLAGWNLEHWSVDTAARVLVINDLANNRHNSFSATYTDLCRTADLNEQIALYRATCLLEPNEALDAALGEGLRTSIQSVFEAIAHHNPYPKNAFDAHRWNHMVLKALFIESTLHPIVGLDERANPELAAILCDYAHERWAANRPVTPELWRCVGPFATTDSLLKDLHKALNDSTPGSTEGALLALSSCPHPDALPKPLRELHRTNLTAIDRGELTWAAVYETFS